MTCFYHGGPLWPEETCTTVWQGTGGLVSFARPEQVECAFLTAQRVILDNGAFNSWQKDGANKTWGEWQSYYQWTDKFINHPRLAFNVVPDGIEVGETRNKELAIKHLENTPEKDKHKWAVVWHLDESYAYLRWCMENFSIVCCGSTSLYPPGSKRFMRFMHETFKEVICDSNGQPKVKIHMLRGLRKELRCFPFSSADSSFVATHMNKKDKMWRKLSKLPNAHTRARILKEDIENKQFASFLEDTPTQDSLFKEAI